MNCYYFSLLPAFLMIFSLPQEAFPKPGLLFSKPQQVLVETRPAFWGFSNKKGPLPQW
jgi:hypothetical protein